jgi:hypothetical protein
VPTPAGRPAATPAGRPAATPARDPLPPSPVHKGEARASALPVTSHGTAAAAARTEEEALPTASLPRTHAPPVTPARGPSPPALAQHSLGKAAPPLPPHVGPTAGGSAASAAAATKTVRAAGPAPPYVPTASTSTSASSTRVIPLRKHHEEEDDDSAATAPSTRDDDAPRCSIVHAQAALKCK